MEWNGLGVFQDSYIKIYGIGIFLSFQLEKSFFRPRLLLLNVAITIYHHGTYGRCRFFIYFYYNCHFLSLAPFCFLSTVMV